ncbi:MAG: hypothetical protein ACFE0J_11715 [Elainellaceae cyanobacterium]
MVLARLHKFITASTRNPADPRVIFWFSLSLAFAALYSGLALAIAFSGDYIVQDDARQYVFWMQRFFDPSLFPDDLIADYFQSVSPLGYVTLYRGAAAVGIHPFLLNKLLPLGLSLTTTAFCFALTLQILPLPFTGFVASLLLNQTLWMKDDLVSASPRSFVYPFFLAFLGCVCRYQSQRHSSNSHSTHSWRRWLILSLGAIALLGSFYPQYLLVSAGVLLLCLVRWENGRLRFSSVRRDYSFVAIHLGVIFSMLLVYAFNTSDFGPVVTAEQARAMPEFWPKGRNFFFNENLWWFYGVGDRSGYLHVGLVRPATLALSLFLPLLFVRPAWFPILRQITSNGWLLIRLWITATVLFGLAHLLLFRLHLPARYTDHSLRIITAIAAAMFMTAVFDAVMRASWRSPAPNQLPRLRRPVLAWGTTLFMALLLFIYPAFVENFPLTKYKTGNTPQIYEFFQQQPPDTLIASVDEEVNNLPVFSQKSILIGREFGIPYHLGYYNEFEDRALEMIRAQYTPNLEELQAFIRAYTVDFWLVDRDAFSAEYVTDIWIRQYQTDLTETLAQLQAGEVPMLKKLIKPCSVLTENRLVVIDATCILAK